MNVSMQENVVTRHIMGENPSAESPWQRGTFSEKQDFYRFLHTPGEAHPSLLHRYIVLQEEKLL